MRFFAGLCLLFSVTMSSCKSQSISEEKYYGIYVSEDENNLDTLILNRDSTFYHSVYVDGNPIFKQTASFYIKGWAILREYREDATVKNGGWDMVAFYDNVTGQIKVAVDRDAGIYYTKVKDY